METNIYWSLLGAFLGDLLLSFFTTTIEVVSKLPCYWIFCLAWFVRRLLSVVVTFSGNRQHLLRRRRWWLCTLEAGAVVLDKFIIMAAHAAHSCRTMTKFSFFARHGGKKVASEAPETLECVRQRPVTSAALLAAVTCLAGLSTPDAFFWSDNQDDDEHLPGGRGLRMGALAFHCFNSVSSLVVLTLLMARAVTGNGHGFCSSALRVSSGSALIGLTAAWSRRSLTTSICFSALVVAVFLCIGLQVLAFLRKPVEHGSHNTEETLQKYSEQWDTAESEDHRDPRETVDDADQHLQKFRNYLLLLAILAASITYQAGMNPPGGLWEENATDGLHHYRAGDPIPPTKYSRMYQAFFYSNATAFAASLVTLIILLSNRCRTRGIKNCVLQVAMILDPLGLIRAHATGSYSESSDPAVAEDDPNSPIKRTPLEATWRVSSSALHHMTGNLSLLLTDSYKTAPLGNNCSAAVIMVPLGSNGDAVPLQVRGSGSVRTESVTLDDVWYVPGLDSNLVSTGQLARQGCFINLGPDGCRITRGGAMVGTARLTEACQFELGFLKVAA